MTLLMRSLWAFFYIRKNGAAKIDVLVETADNMMILIMMVLIEGGSWREEYRMREEKSINV